MPPWKEKREAMHHYDRQAKFYHVQYLDEQTAKIVDSKKRLNFNERELILDMGCGTGILFQFIKEKVGYVVGLDFSKEAIRQAKKSATNRSNVHLIRADADNAPFQKYTFHKVFAITILQNMPDPTRTISEIKKITKPRGLIIVTGLKKSFTKDNFVKILEKSGLKIETLSSNDQLKGHIAICTSRK